MAKSPYEEQIETLKGKLENPELSEESWGPRKFVDAILEHDLEDEPKAI